MKSGVWRGAVRPWLVETKRLLLRLRRTIWFRRQLATFSSNLVDPDHLWPFGKLYPCLDDLDDDAGVISGHYFHQDLHVAQKIFESAPSRHLDIGSRIDGFVAHVASFRNIDVIDIRPMRSPNNRVNFLQADFMDHSAVQSLGRWPSVSCLHALEHFGLGRYGDPLIPNGWLKGIHSLAMVTEEGGVLHLSVPVGKQRIEFNAHRVFGPRTLLAELSPWFTLTNFAMVDDGGDLLVDIEPDLQSIESKVALLEYGCGIFTLVRKSS